MTAGRRAPTALFAVVLALCATVGAAVGASMAPAPSTKYRATATVAPHVGASAARELRYLRRVERALRLEPVLASVSALAATNEVAQHLEVRVDSALRVLTVTAVAADATTAKLRADAAALISSRYVESLDGVRRGRTAVGSFERGFDAWASGGPLFVVPPKRLTRVRGQARFGSYFLRSRCVRQAACGPWVRLYYPFRAGVEYTVTGWTRSNVRGVRLAAVLGANEADLGEGPQLPQTSAWRPFTVTWTPVHTRDSAELVVATTRRTTARIDVDGVSLAESGAAPIAPSESFFRLFPTMYTVPAAVVASGAAGARLAGAAVGALVGLAVGACGVAAGRAARRREQRQT
ncbi:MAG TPA: hypothetical protein VM204_00390 [Gaiellaceae bacterium]|nr:hypothetical protein [Gaiellaceae bacterium]